MARRIRLPAPTRRICAAFAELRESLDVSVEFPADVVEDAERSIRSPRLPDADETAIPFVTIDPPESLDLDQALHIERRGTWYRVRYAIADVAAFVTPGGPMDREAHVRGQTLYAPDGNARLYPPQLSEGGGSLLPGETRPALLWTMDVDPTGEGIEVDVRRALVRSREKLDYAGVQRSLDDGTADESLNSSARSACSVRSARCAGAGSPCRSRSRRSTRAPTATGSRSARRSPWRGGTHRFP